LLVAGFLASASAWPEPAEAAVSNGPSTSASEVVDLPEHIGPRSWVLPGSRGGRLNDAWLSTLADLCGADIARQKSALDRLRRLHRALLTRRSDRGLLAHPREEELFSAYLMRLCAAYRRHCRATEPAQQIRNFYALSRRIVQSAVVDEARRRTPEVDSLCAKEEPSDGGAFSADTLLAFDLARALADLPQDWSRALEALIRRGSVRAAAEELGLTQAQARYRVGRARASIARGLGLERSKPQR
jgi:hypothetical protein